MQGSARAILDGLAGSSVEGRVAALEPSYTERRGLKLTDVWQRWSPPRQFGGVLCQGTLGSTGAILDGEAGFSAEGCVAALEPSLMERRGLVPRGTGQRMDTCLALCHGLKHVLVGTRYAGYRQRHPAFCLGSMQTCLYCSRESQRAHFPIWGPSGPDLHDFGWVTGVICAALASSSALKALNVKGISKLSVAMGNQRKHASRMLLPNALGPGLFGLCPQRSWSLRTPVRFPRWTCGMP
jgi:hypothetical protein